MPDKALLLNGIFESVLEEILRFQAKYPGRVFYLQPYAGKLIKELESSLPTPDNPMWLYITTTKRLNEVSYIAEIIDWEDKRKISKERLAILNQHIQQFQPKEKEIYFQVKGKICVNLISIRNLKRLDKPIPRFQFRKISDSSPINENRKSSGPIYVYPIQLEELIDKEQKERNQERYISEDKTIPCTEREALIKARIGQGRFREEVIKVHKFCPFTGISDERFLTAGHIKPWADCNDNKERLDPLNGLPLTPLADFLVDNGYASFTDEGKIIFSSRLNKEEMLRMGLDITKTYSVKVLNEKQKEYFEYHRTHKFIP